MAATGRVTVAGAGAIGLTTALALARAGFEVTVHDPAALSANASGVAAGMLAPAFESLLDPVSAGRFELLRAARDLWPKLAASIGLDLDRRGAAFVGATDQVERLAAGLDRLGVASKRLAGADLRSVCGGLQPGLTQGVLTDADWRLDAPTALAALRRAAEDLGVRFEATEVPAAWGGLLVIATGASQSLRPIAPELELLAPIKGQILRIARPAPGPILRGEGVYIAPSGQGLLAGATMEPGVDDTLVDLSQSLRLLAAAARLLPELAEAEFTAAAGVRAATPDGLPLAGWSGEEGVLLAVGARRNGWLLAPLIAQEIVGQLGGGEQTEQGRAFAPARFARPPIPR